MDDSPPPVTDLLADDAKQESTPQASTRRAADSKRARRRSTMPPLDVGPEINLMIFSGAWEELHERVADSHERERLWDQFLSVLGAAGTEEGLQHPGAYLVIKTALAHFRARVGQSAGVPPEA